MTVFLPFFVHIYIFSNILSFFILNEKIVARNLLAIYLMRYNPSLKAPVKKKKIFFALYKEVNIQILRSIYSRSQYRCR